jgi:glycosyltransferase involved in cell wall biosynthesis
MHALSAKNVCIVEGASKWICCQLGARDHYSVPRGLHRRGLLEGLITEAWVPPTSALASLPRELGERLRERYDKGLADANVLHCSASIVGFEMRARIKKSRNIWDRIIARNNWFQSRAVQRMKALLRDGDQRSARVVFAYSYAAREILRTARDLGFTTILGQIDPGPAEERIVAEVCLRNDNPMASWQRIPDSYWDAWREECDLCHHIVVNSPWAYRALIGEGMPPEKIHVIPVAYDPPDEANRLTRVYPKSFSTARPLRVLFLGSLIPRKGIHEMLEATNLLRSAPVEFWFVGPRGVELCLRSTENPRLRWTGPVARKQAHDFYRDADIFILPTHSDGFGLTQLEAMARGLPVIASENCGEAVCHAFNGLVLSTVTAEAIAEAIDWCLKNAETLDHMSHCAILTSNEFRTDHVVNKLLHCAQEGT